MSGAFLMNLRGPIILDHEHACREAVYGELDNIISLLSDVCEELSKIREIHFSVGGFGLADWRASVWMDLCVVLEQLPAIVNALMREDREFALDFFEQSLERTLRFVRHGSSLTVTCVSRHAGWAPDPASVEMPVADFEDMLANLVKEFGRLVQGVCPQQARHPWFLEWYASASARRSGT